MATQKEIADYILSQISEAGVVRMAKMFGEYGLYCDEKFVGLICDNQLFIKPTQAGMDYLVEVEEGAPFPGAKPWFLISEDSWDDSEWLSGLVRITAPELPFPKPKKKKT
jgi:DNA transformation protein